MSILSLATEKILQFQRKNIQGKKVALSFRYSVLSAGHGHIVLTKNVRYTPKDTQFLSNFMSLSEWKLDVLSLFSSPFESSRSDDFNKDTITQGMFPNGNLKTSQLQK